MDQLFEFIVRHPILCGSFALLLVGFAVTEIRRGTSRFKWISAADAVQLINRKNAVVLDVSAKNDHARAHIVDAYNFTASELNADNRQLMKLQGQPLIVYCKTGQASYQQAGKLVKLGFDPVYVLRGGLLKWQEEHLPVEA